MHDGIMSSMTSPLWAADPPGPTGEQPRDPRWWLSIAGMLLLVGALLLVVVPFSVDRSPDRDLDCNAIILVVPSAAQGERYPEVCEIRRTRRLAWSAGLGLAGTAMITLALAPTVIRRVEAR